MKNRILPFILYIYVLLNFFKIHTINSNIINGIIILYSGYCIYKKYYNISFFLLLVNFLTIPLWILFNNFYSKFFLHYPILSDISVIIATALILRLFLFKSCINRYSLMFITLYFLYPYLAYDRTLYWIVIFLLPLPIFVGTSEKVFTDKNKWFLIFSLFFIFLYSVSFVPSKQPQSIGILQSNWCDVSKIPDKKSFTMDYFYAYSDFYNLLNSYAKTQTISNQDIKENKLKYDSIVLITPTNIFSPIEVYNLSQYVLHGGKLIIIADHTNLYGHADNLNPLLNVFGVKLNDDTLYDVFDYYKEYHINISSKILTEMQTKTNSSLLLPIHAKIWAISDIIISEKADYTKNNFFGNLDFTEDDVVGSFPVGATIKWGLGDVTIWTDSTLFSNFAITQINNLYLLDYLINKRILNDNTRKIPYRKINICADKKILREAPPQHLPENNHFSTLIANLTRYDIFPLYNAKHKNIPQLMFMTYNDFLLNKEELMKVQRKIILYGDIPTNNIFDIKTYSIHTKKEIPQCREMCFYSKDGSEITIKWGKSNILFSKNTFTDKEMGNWWNTITISPYKKYMLDSFNEWISYGKNIVFFNYPQLEYTIHNVSLSYDNGNKENLDKLKISKKTNYDNYDWVYLGNRQWGIQLKNRKIIGGPETIDAFTKIQDMQKWIIKY